MQVAGLFVLFGVGIFLVKIFVGFGRVGLFGDEGQIVAQGNGIGPVGGVFLGIDQVLKARYAVLLFGGFKAGIHD